VQSKQRSKEKPESVPLASLLLCVKGLLRLPREPIGRFEVQGFPRASPCPVLAVAWKRTPAKGFLDMSSVAVLLVEDNEDNRTIYTTILRHCGHEVAEAATGEEGIRLARELRPGVILMDVAMPGIDGWEATRRLKADPETAHIPVVALTAHAMAEDRQRAADAGCESYLAKPVEPRKVVEEVERLLARAVAAAAE
jgi:two-component system cell cycle response regulator DivK